MGFSLTRRPLCSEVRTLIPPSLPPYSHLDMSKPSNLSTVAGLPPGTGSVNGILGGSIQTQLTVDPNQYYSLSGQGNPSVFSTKVLEVVIGQILHQSGFEKISKDAKNVLVEVFVRYLNLLAVNTKKWTEADGRSQSNFHDVFSSLHEILGHGVTELNTWAKAWIVDGTAIRTMVRPMLEKVENPDGTHSYTTVMTPIQENGGFPRLEPAPYPVEIEKVQGLPPPHFANLLIPEDDNVKDFWQEDDHENSRWKHFQRWMPPLPEDSTWMPFLDKDDRTVLPRIERDEEEQQLVILSKHVLPVVDPRSLVEDEEEVDEELDLEEDDDEKTKRRKQKNRLAREKEQAPDPFDHLVPYDTSTVKEFGLAMDLQTETQPPKVYKSLNPKRLLKNALESLKNGSAVPEVPFRPPPSMTLLTPQDPELIMAEKKVTEMLNNVKAHKAVLGPMLAFTESHNSKDELPYPAPHTVTAAEFDAYYHKTPQSSMFSLQVYSPGGYLKNVVSEETLMGKTSGWAAMSKLNGRMDVRKGVWGVVHTKIRTDIGPKEGPESIAKKVAEGPVSRQMAFARAVKAGLIPATGLGRRREKQPKKRGTFRAHSPTITITKDEAYSPIDTPPPASATPIPAPEPVAAFAAPSVSIFEQFARASGTPTGERKPNLPTGPVRRQLIPSTKPVSTPTSPKPIVPKPVVVPKPIVPKAPVFDVPEREDDPDTLLPGCLCKGAKRYTFMMACDYCDEWYHGPCLDPPFLQEYQYKAWVNEHGDKWKCPKCIAKDEKSGEGLGQVKEEVIG